MKRISEMPRASWERAGRSASLGACVLLLVAAGRASSTTFHVSPDGSGDFPTIQAAVDAAVTGDEILLADGTFTGDGNRGITFGGKALSMKSQSDDPSRCIIDCASLNHAMAFHYISSGTAILKGITVTGGYWGLGGAIDCWHASVLIVNCVFRSNLAQNQSGAINVQTADVEVRDCVLVDNTAEYLSAGALFAGLYASVRIVGCTIARNTESVANEEGDIVCLRSSRVDIDHSILVGDPGGPSVTCDETSTITVRCSDVFGNAGGDWVDCIASQAHVEGNFCAPPLFCDPEHGVFTLSANSPCAPPGITGCGLIGGLPVACGATSVEPRSWGQIKSAYR